MQQIISLNTLVVVIIVPNARTSGEQLPIYINFVSIARGAQRNILGTDISKKDLEVNFIIMKKHKNFRFLSGCGKALPALKPACDYLCSVYPLEW